MSMFCRDETDEANVATATWTKDVGHHAGTLLVERTENEDFFLSRGCTKGGDFFGYCAWSIAGGQTRRLSISGIGASTFLASVPFSSIRTRATLSGTSHPKFGSSISLQDSKLEEILGSPELHRHRDEFINKMCDERNSRSNLNCRSCTNQQDMITRFQFPRISRNDVSWQVSAQCRAAQCQESKRAHESWTRHKRWHRLSDVIAVAVRADIRDAATSCSSRLPQQSAPITVTARRIAVLHISSCMPPENHRAFLFPDS